MVLTIILFVLCLVLLPSAGFAYIDPGTSGFALSFLRPLLAMAAGFLGIFFRPIWRGLKSFGCWGKTHIPIFIGILTVVILVLGCGIYYLLF